MPQQGAFSRWADPGDLLQARLPDVLLTPRAVGADGEAVGLVAQTLDEIEQWVARRQLEWAAARHEEGLAPGVAVGPLGHRDQRHIANPHSSERLLRRSELPLAAVDQHKIGPGGVRFIFILRHLLTSPLPLWER